MRLRTQNSSFSSGALDPRMRGRVDTEHYKNGAKVVKNALIHPHGGAFRRPALEFQYDFGTITSAVNMSFEFNTEQTYTLVMYSGAIKVFKDGVYQATITTPWLEADLGQVTWTQSADTLLVFHEDYEPRVITRTSHTVWTINTWSVSNIPQFAYTLAITQPTIDITPSAITGKISITAGAGLFLASDVGCYILGNGGEARITKYISNVKVEAVVVLDFIDTSLIPTGTWDFERGYVDVWSASKGWPRSATFHQNRLVLGGSKSRPSTLWGSMVGSFFDFDIGAARADDGFSYTIDTDQVNEIRQLLSAETLQVFTSGGDFVVPELTDGITPTNIRFIRQDTKGIANVKPVFADGSAMFPQKDASIIREFLFDSLKQKYDAVNISLVSGHLIKTPVAMCHQQSHGESDSDLIYVVNTDGTWAVLNSLRRQQITAWVEGETPGGTVVSMSFEGSHVYASVKRTINSTTKIYLERFNFSKFMDSGVSVVSGAPTDAWSGLGHLEGEEVWVYGDVQSDGTAYVEGPHVVSSGAITTDSEYTTAEIGLFFVPEVELQPVERELPDGSMSGEIRRVVSATTRFNDTTNITVNGVLIPLRRFGQDVFDGPLPLTTDDRKTRTLGYSRNPQIVISQETPGPFHLLAVVLEVQIK